MFVIHKIAAISKRDTMTLQISRPGKLILISDIPSNAPDLQSGICTVVCSKHQPQSVFDEYDKLTDR